MVLLALKGDFYGCMLKTEVRNTVLQSAVGERIVIQVSVPWNIPDIQSCTKLWGTGDREIARECRSDTFVKMTSKGSGGNSPQDAFILSEGNNPVVLG